MEEGVGGGGGKLTLIFSLTHCNIFQIFLAAFGSLATMSAFNA